MGSSNHDLISIIIPVYNVERYLVPCVKSVLEQTYSCIEVFLIDDGSTDGSGRICDDLSAQDPRIHVLHKENGGLSDARNCGMEKATGKYIMFVDSDDMVAPTLITTLHSLIATNHCNKFAACRLVHFEDGEQPAFVSRGDCISFSRQAALVNFLCQKEISTSICGKLFLKESLKNICFVKGQRFEDNPFLFHVINRCEKVDCCTAQLYAYRHRTNSITTAKFDEKDFDIIKIGKEILESTADLSWSVHSAAVIYQCANCLRIFLTASSDYLSDERYKYCKQYLAEHAADAIRHKDTRKKLKIGLLLYYIRMPRKIMKAIHSRKKRWS